MEVNELVMAVADEVVRRLDERLVPPQAAEPEYLSLAEVAKRTAFSYDYIYDAVTSRGLPAVKKGREWRVAVADMRKWMDKDRVECRRAPTRSEQAEKVRRLLPGLAA